MQAHTAPGPTSEAAPQPVAFVRSLEVQQLRGIVRGKVAPLSPLTAIVGPNGSGKSTLLDALLIGSHPQPAQAIGRAIARHVGADSARWFRHVRAGEAWARIELAGPGTTVAKTRFHETEPDARAVRELQSRGSPGPYFGLEGVSETGGAEEHFEVVLGADGVYTADSILEPRAFVRMVRLIDSLQEFRSRPLATQFQELKNFGQEASVNELVSQLFPHFERLEIAATSSGAAVLHVAGKGGTVPLDFVGDGARLAIRCALDLASVRTGLALLEEPEAHLHPRGIRLLARVIVASVLRGVQVVLTTHSIDLIDGLLEASERLGLPLDALSVVKTAPLTSAGEVVCDVLDGSNVETAREGIGEDLR